MPLPIFNTIINKHRLLFEGFYDGFGNLIELVGNLAGACSIMFYK